MIHAAAAAAARPDADDAADTGTSRTDAHLDYLLPSPCVVVRYRAAPHSTAEQRNAPRPVQTNVKLPRRVLGVAKLHCRTEKPEATR